MFYRGHGVKLRKQLIIQTYVTSLRVSRNWLPQMSRCVIWGRDSALQNLSTIARRLDSRSSYSEEMSKTRSCFKSITVCRTFSRRAGESSFTRCITKPVRVSRRSRKLQIRLMLVREMLRCRRLGSNLTVFFRHSEVNLVLLTLRTWRFLSRPNDTITGILFSSMIAQETLRETRFSTVDSPRQPIRLFKFNCLRLVAVTLYSLKSRRMRRAPGEMATSRKTGEIRSTYLAEKRLRCSSLSICRLQSLTRIFSAGRAVIRQVGSGKRQTHFASSQSEHFVMTDWRFLVIHLTQISSNEGITPEIVIW